MVAETGGDIDIIVGMMNDMEAPEKGNLVFGDMHQPATKEIQHQEGYDHRAQHSGICPIYYPKLLFPAPVTDQNDDQGEKSVNDEVDNGKGKIDKGMPGF